MGLKVRDKRFNIPMALTWARIAFIPLIVGIFYVPDVLLSPHVKNVAACVMFVLAAACSWSRASRILWTATSPAATT